LHRVEILYTAGLLHTVGHLRERNEHKFTGEIPHSAPLTYWKRRQSEHRLAPDFAHLTQFTHCRCEQVCLWPLCSSTEHRSAVEIAHLTHFTRCLREQVCSWGLIWPTRLTVVMSREHRLHVDCSQSEPSQYKAPQTDFHNQAWTESTENITTCTWI
jgi:hypothetical protein